MDDGLEVLLEHASPNGFRFCGVKESLLEEARRRARTFAWKNKRALNWYIGDRIPGISLRDYTLCAKRSFNSIQKVCGLTFTQVFESGRADFKLLTRPIDGSGGTLAEHELPMGDDRPVRGWWDTQDKWTLQNPPSKKLILLDAVMLHEHLHGCGLDHTEKTRTLMNPYYDPSVYTIGEWETKELQRRYGPPVEEPEELPDDNKDVGKELTLEFDGVLYGPVMVFPKNK